jgi:hypothetical protein
MFKRMLNAICLLLAAASVSYAINTTGTNSQNEFSFFKVGYLRHSVQDSITALAGGGQTGATQIVAALNRVTTVASANDSVMLPSCVAGASNTFNGTGNTTGMEIIITNAAAANALAVFPQVGQSINALSANAAFSLAAGKTATMFCSPGGTIWYINLSA